MLQIFNVEEKRGILEFLRKRSAPEMIGKITQHVRAGSTIYTDEHKSYSSLQSLGFEHRTVNHSKGFKTIEGVHTNHIEPYLGRLKRIIAQKNVREHSFLSSHLDEFMWRERHRKDT